MVVKNMEKMLRSKLENKLAEFDTISPITNDEELKAALKKIIEETEPKDEADILMLDEAVDMLLELETVDVGEIKQAAEAWSETYLNERDIHCKSVETTALEEKLNTFNIDNDKDLKAALTDLIENTVPENEKQVELVDEAVEMLLQLEGVDTDEIDKSTKAWSENYLANHKHNYNHETRMRRKSIKIKWLIPVAALLSILCISVIVSSAAGIDVWNLTKEFYSSLTEKVTHFFNGSSIISTTDYKKYKSLEDLIEQENLSDILLPLDMPEDYMVDNLSYDDFDNIKRINMDVLKKGQKIASICIKTSYNANFEETKITEVCGFNGYETHYDDVYQFEFDYLTDYYIVYSNDHDELVCILDSLLGVS